MSSASAVPVLLVPALLVPAVQRVAGPATRAGYEALRAAGRLVDLARRPLRVTRCEHCRGTTVGETCPQSLPCTTCGAEPGRRCTRSSEHEAACHAPRWRAAERVDNERAAAGDPTLPAPWAQAPATPDHGRPRAG